MYTSYFFVATKNRGELVASSHKTMAGHCGRDYYQYFK